MDTTESSVVILKRKAGKEFADMTDESFTNLMSKQSKEDLIEIRQNLVNERDFNKRILLEEYRKTHPNSFRYTEAEAKIERINAKGKVLKTIIDSK